MADADVLVFCIPHQFVRATCKRIMGKTKPGAFAVSLIKGMRVTADGPQLISQMITKYLGVDCSVLMVRIFFVGGSFSLSVFSSHTLGPLSDQTKTILVNNNHNASPIPLRP